MIAGNNIHYTNTNQVSGGTVSLSGQLNLGSSVNVITLGPSMVNQKGTYTPFSTGAGIVWNGSLLPANSDLAGIIDFRVPTGYAVALASVSSNGLDINVRIRQAVIAA